MKRPLFQGRLVILHGSGKNGKSTLINLFYDLLGDYARRTPTDSLMVSKKGVSDIPNDIARLRGIRFVTLSESEQNQRLAESKIKDITGAIL